MTTTALILGIAGLVFSSLSLGWNIAQYALSGSRPRAALLPGAVTSCGAALVTWPSGSSWDDQLQSLFEQGFDPKPVLTVKLTNFGRAPVRVERWAVLEKRFGVSFVPLADSLGPDLPYDLPAGANATWAVDMQTVQRLVNATASTFGETELQILGRVTLGTGREIKTRSAVSIRTTPTI